MHAAAAALAAGPLDTALDSLSRLVPKVLGFLAIVAIGWLTATLLRRLTARLLHRVNFNHALERGGLTRLGETNTYDPTAVLARGVYYSILLIALTLAFGVFGDNPVTALLTGVVAFLPKAAIAAVIVLVSAAIARGVRELVNGILGGLSYARLMGNLAGAFLLGLGIIAALNQIGVATTVTTPVLITVLATIGGILVVGVGGGLIRPMQRRWERWLDVAEREGRNISDTVQQNTEPPVVTEPAYVEPEYPVADFPATDYTAVYSEPAYAEPVYAEYANAEQTPAAYLDAEQQYAEHAHGTQHDEPTQVFSAVQSQQ